MKKSSKHSVYRLVAAALFLALGVLFPQIFHLFGATAGQIFLPMHIPVILSGYVLGPVYGAVVGVLSPTLSCVLTSMPMPIKLPFMIFELGIYGLTAGLFDRLFRQKFGKRTYSAAATLIPVQIAGRIANALCILVAVYLLRIQSPAITVASIWTSVASGLPGLIVQWIFIPVLVVILRRVTKNFPLDSNRK